MKEFIVNLDENEQNMVIAALAQYRVAGFPLGRSSFENPIYSKDREEWATLGMAVWDKIVHLQPKP